MFKIKSIILNKTSIILIVIVLLAFVLRFYKVDMIPSGLYWDEAAIALDAKSISQTGKDQHNLNWLQPIYPSWGDYKLAGYILFSAPFFYFWGFNPALAVRLPSVIAGTITVLVIYYLSKEIFLKLKLKKHKAKALSLLSSLILCTSPWHLQFSRAAFEGNLALLFLSLSLLFFIKAKNIKPKKTIVYLVFALAFSFLSLYTYYSARFVLPLLLVVVFLIFWKIKFRNIIYFLLFSLLLFLSYLPLLKSPLFQKSEQFRLSTKNILSDVSIIKYSSKLIEQDTNNLISKKIHHRFLYIAKGLVRNIFDHISLNYLLITGDSNLRHSTTRIGTLLVIVFLGLLYGEYILWQKAKKLFIFLNAGVLISLLPAAVPYETPHSLRSLNAIIFFTIVSAFGLTFLFYKFKHNKILLVAGCWLLAAQMFFYLHDYYVHYSKRSYDHWQGGYKEAVKLAWQEFNNYDQIIFTNIYARPYIYFLLYSDYPIAEFQDQRRDILNLKPLDFSETMQIDKINFKNIDFDVKELKNKTLVIGSPEEITSGTKIDKLGNFVVWKNY